MAPMFLFSVATRFRRLSIPRASALFLLAALLAPAPGRARAADEWPQFRGSQDLSGVARGELKEPLKLLWIHKTGGPVKSSAAIDGGRIFVGSDDGTLRALDPATGGLLWSFQAGEAVESSPLALKGAVYFGSGDGRLYALDAETGALKWKFACGDKIPGAPNWSAGELPFEGQCS